MTQISHRPAAADTPAALSNRELRAMFGRNLRVLCAAGSSLSAACRALAINRSQFNRYLAGTAFPQPEVLHRICQHFGVDARILLEPLPLPPEPGMITEVARVLRSFVAPNLDYTVDPALLPDGYYQIWRRSFLMPERAIVSLARIWRDGMITRFKSYEPHLIDPHHADLTRPPMHPCNGFFLRGEDGLVLITLLRVTRTLRFCYLRQGYAGFGTLMPGYAVLGRDRAEGMARSAGVMLERLPAQLPDLRQRARAAGYRDAEAVPALFRNHVMSAAPV